MAAHPALLGLFAYIHLNPVIKLAHARILAADIVLDVGVKKMYQKM